MAETWRQKRKLVAVLSIDVVGYSRLMQDDEEATLETLRSYRATIDRLAQQHAGRIVNAPGDNILAEFPSAVEAVRAAIDIQEVIGARNRELSEHRRMRLRIGANLGDVLVEPDGTLYGDGVNVAARMESLAEAGGIVISAKVHDEVKGRVPQAFADLGPQQVKNIAEPIRAYRVVAEGAEPPRAEAAPPGRRKLRRMALIASVVAVAGAAAWLVTRSPEPETAAEAVGEVGPETEVASLERMAFPLPEEPSIAVLPFDNLSGDPAHDYLADGLSENIISALSQTRGIMVIARNSTFTYKGEAVKVQEVAEALGVRYVLEGSIQVAGSRLRATAQLIDALTGDHIWSERYDRAVDDVFAVQDDITLNVVSALQVQLTEGPHALVWRGGTKSLEAWSLFQRGREHLLRFTSAKLAEARRLFEQAVAIDPTFALALAQIGNTHRLEVPTPCHALRPGRPDRPVGADPSQHQAQGGHRRDPGASGA